MSRGVGPSGSEVKLEMKKWPELLKIGLLKYPGALVISPYFTILFFSNSPPLIFFNFNKFHFLSVYFLFLWVDVLSIRVYDRIYWISFSVYENFHFGLLPILSMVNVTFKLYIISILTCIILIRKRSQDVTLKSLQLNQDIII